MTCKQCGLEKKRREDDTTAGRILDLFRIVERKATGRNAPYAKTYARAGHRAYSQYGMEGLETQILYVLNNLGGWKGPEAKQVKRELKRLSR